MKKLAIAVLLSVFFVTSAFAAASKGNVGANFSSDNVFGIQGELDISSMTNNAPLSAQLFWKNYSQDLGPNNTWDTSAIGAAAIYDFSSIAKLDKKIRPYAGVGLMTVFHNWNGAGAPVRYTGVVGGLYVTFGLRYFLAPQIDADFNYNNFGDLTAGVNFNFK